MPLKRPGIAAAVVAASLTPFGVPAAVFLGECQGADALPAGEAREVLLLGRVVSWKAAGCWRRARRWRSRARTAARVPSPPARRPAPGRCSRPRRTPRGSQGPADHLLTHLLPHLGLVALGGLHEATHLGLRRLVGQEAANRPAQFFLLVAESKVHAVILGGWHPLRWQVYRPKSAVGRSTRPRAAQQTPCAGCGD